GFRRRGRQAMSRLGLMKWAVVASWVAGAILLAAPRSFSKTDTPPADSAGNSVVANSDDYVGSDAGSGRHDEQFKSISKITHSRVARAKWRSERQGCESCHGPGKAHIEGGGDKTKIRTFEHETAKQTSDVCLTCHAGKEEHNNFRRGEHWRNDISCTDCHSP